MTPTIAATRVECSSWERAAWGGDWRPTSKAIPTAGRTLYGILDDAKPLGKGVIGRVSDLARLARTGFVDEVILAAPHDRPLMQQVLREARRLRLDVKLVPELFGCPPRGEVERVGDLPVISLHAERSPS